MKPIAIKNSWIGLDESGKGDYFGPLVVAGVQADPEISAQLTAWGVKDSKRLSDKRILDLEPMIRQACRHSIVAIGPERYNELYEKFRNLNKLLAWAHARTLENLLSEGECPRAIADQFGDERLIKNALMEKGRKIVLEQRPRAEEDPAVAAASILARAEFLKRIKRLSEEQQMDLPKGASDRVRDAAVKLVREKSAEELKKVAKWHFKTTQQVLEASRLR
ncbi:MAG: ribonuclease HIII [Nitrospirae bacterium]|nr:ribonuclease HIII [Nitrospirota bacterium]